MICAMASLASATARAVLSWVSSDSSLDYLAIRAFLDVHHPQMQCCLCRAVDAENDIAFDIA
jgi:hypothetical protein